MSDPRQVTQIRLWCSTHRVPLKIDGRGIILDSIDSIGWATIDTSEMYCPVCNETVNDNPGDWLILAR